MRPEARRSSRAATVVLALLLLVPGCGGGPDGPDPAKRAPEAASPASASAGADKASIRRAGVERAAAAAARRRAELARLRRSRTVEGALRRALLTGRLSPPAHARLRGELVAARGAVRRLTGLRKVELASVLRTVEALAARRELTSERLAPAFLVLRRNTGFWTRAALPVPGSRTTFGSDPAVFQYYSGQGMQLQPLASWGRANAMAADCLRQLRSKKPDHPCRRRALARTLDRLLALGASRGGYLAWEHYFAYGGGTAPWVSGMAQGTAIQALARGSRALGSKRYARAATRALGAFEQPPPAGVAVSAPAGRHYLMYSFSPTLRILNGNLQAVTGLHDAAALLKSRRARRLYRRGERAVRRDVRGFDTGAWSLYSARGREATLGYHQLVGGFLGNLCERTGRGAYCAARKRFVRYEREPPRIRVARARGLRARRPATLAFSLSKVSSVGVRVWGTRGTALTRDVRLPRGRHAFSWTPPGRGRYRVRVEARGPSGPKGVTVRTLRVTQPRPKKKKVRPTAKSRRERAKARARRVR